MNSIGLLSNAEGFYTSSFAYEFTFCSQQRWQSIVMSTSVCEYISRTTCAAFINFFVHVAYCRGSVRLRRGDAIARRRGQLWGFSSSKTMHCTLYTVPYRIAFNYDPYENGWRDRDAVRLNDRQAGKQTHTQTCSLQYFATTPAGEVITH